MAAGTLEITGLINPRQFWPGADSDADTVNITVDLSKSPFRFRAHPDAQFKPTAVFDTAQMKVRDKLKPIVSKGVVRIRCQGVDAPELHYTSSPVVKKATAAQKAVHQKWNGSFRQPLAETAARSLLEFFGGDGTPRKCVVRTDVDKPNDVCDMYARVVGEVFIDDVSLNLWALSNGWAYPGLYNSMSDEEFERVLTAADGARKAKRGVWKNLAKTFSPLDTSLLHRKTAAPKDDKPGPVLLPKLFRKLVVYTVNNKAKLLKGSFKSYLETSGGIYWRTADHLAQGVAADSRKLGDILDAQGKILAGPQDVVFKDDPSILVNASGKPINSW